TRFSRDWSSDVCSSDLLRVRTRSKTETGRLRRKTESPCGKCGSGWGAGAPPGLQNRAGGASRLRWVRFPPVPAKGRQTATERYSRFFCFGRRQAPKRPKNIYNIYKKYNIFFRLIRWKKSYIFKPVSLFQMEDFHEKSLGFSSGHTRRRFAFRTERFCRQRHLQKLERAVFALPGGQGFHHRNPIHFQ